MTELASSVPTWDEVDLVALLTLDETAPGHYRSRLGDPNLNGRAFGGQLLGQTLAAAALTAPAERMPTAMQLLFLQGAFPDQAIDFEVESLQDGKRFSSRHVRGRQGDSRSVLDAHVTFGLPLPSPEHATPLSAVENDPEDLPPWSEQSRYWEERLRPLGGYALRDKACMDFRMPGIEREVSPEAVTTRVRFWLKARQRLPGAANVHAAALAYFSDWWLNFSSLGAHLHTLGPHRQLYVSSLNHSIWFHRQVAADEWMHFDSRSDCAANGRGLSTAQIHNQQGELIASATQECLMAYV